MCRSYRSYLIAKEPRPAGAATSSRGALVAIEVPPRRENELNQSRLYCAERKQCCRRCAIDAILWRGHVVENPECASAGCRTQPRRVGASGPAPEKGGARATFRRCRVRARRFGG